MINIYNQHAVGQRPPPPTPSPPKCDPTSNPTLLSSTERDGVRPAVASGCPTRKRGPAQESSRERQGARG